MFLLPCYFSFIIEEPMYEICGKTKLDIVEEGSIARTTKLIKKERY